MSEHDADHSREAQLEEFATVWPLLRPGGVVICDDVASSSLMEFAAMHEVDPMAVPRERYGDVIGVLARR